MLKVSYAYETVETCSKLTASACLQFDSPNAEDYSIGTPQCWDDAFLSKVNIDKYKIFHVCYKLVARGLHNSVTDRKAVWGLNGIPQGKYTDAYNTDAGKLYIGVTCGQGESCFRSDISTVIVLIPHETPTSGKDIGEMFTNTRCDFSTESRNFILKSITEQVNGSIALAYSFADIICLEVFGLCSDNFFSESDISAWPSSDPALVYRKGLMPYGVMNISNEF